jgi:hypothetical protein
MVNCTGTGSGAQTTDCDRVTSLSFYCSGSTSNCWLYAWPNDVSATNCCLPALVVRYLSWAFHRDHSRAASRHSSLQ